MARSALSACVFDQLVVILPMLHQTALRLEGSLANLTNVSSVHVSMCCQSHFCREHFIAFLTFDGWNRLLLGKVRLAMNRQIVAPFEFHAASFALPPSNVGVGQSMLAK